MSDVIRHPLFARLYSAVVAPGMTRLGAEAYRAELLDGLSGTVVEVGAGDGANFTHYPTTVERVIAIEPEAYLRGKAAGRAGQRIEVREGTAAALPVPDGSADAVVFCLVLCSVSDVATALAEARRVLRPGGELRILEHVQSHEPGRMRGVQQALDATVWPRLFGGCHTGRDTVGAVESAGFGFTELRRFAFPEGSRSPVSPAVMGRARAS